jgi:hypothetical protein
MPLIGIALAATGWLAALLPTIRNRPLRNESDFFDLGFDLSELLFETA